jgi:hypothetical protein
MMTKNDRELVVDGVYETKDGGQAKVLKFDNYYVHYVSRSNPKGRWGKAVEVLSRRKFWNDIADSGLPINRKKAA